MMKAENKGQAQVAHNKRVWSKNPPLISDGDLLQSRRINGLDAQISTITSFSPTLT